MPGDLLGSTRLWPGAALACWRSTRCLLAATLLLATGCGDGNNNGGTPAEPTTPTAEPTVFATEADLGESLFFDTNLSLNRTQACATCHDPERAFTDSRLDDDGLPAAFPLGDDGLSRGSRNAPTAAYAALAPTFQFGTHERYNSQQSAYEGYIGGQFLDGRAADLEAQAKGPPLNPIEMGMPDEASVVERLQENPDYAASFRALYGDDIFADTEAAFDAMASSIAAFERSEAFSSFDSKYDKSLRGDYLYEPGSKAALGKALFFSQQFTNCATCHQLRPNGSRDETFTNYEYHNIGTPVNEAARLAANIPLDDLDEGLLANPEVDDPAQIGKYKVPTLRNVAVTAPYMNNGVFRKLETVIRFYDKFLPGSDNLVNPETGSPWREPPFPDTVSLEELADSPRLSEDDIVALVCFLRTLTDERYEHLIEEDGIICD
ncbi:MAG: c-type cytochrome [Pseudomonadales bacterium]|nr:c-type cytochrome [Halieaceae bacterium]MCP5189358.1 c-type cytochrome [Pseudomonadales bacterium]